MTFALKIEGLNFSYGDKLVLKNINLEVQNGDYLGIIGPNGSGKSTLIKVVLGILKRDSGKVKIFGQDICDAKRIGKIGYISQKANSFNGDFPATVFEVVGAGLNRRHSIFKSYSQEETRKIDSALEIVGLKNNKYNLIGRLSGGQQQRVFIARALVGNPKILFLDEPMVGVDQESEDAVYCLLAKLNKEMGITIIMVTHDISAVTVHANRIACMGNGGLNLHDMNKKITNDDIENLYSYGVNIHAHKHECKNCFFKKEFKNKRG